MKHYSFQFMVGLIVLLGSTKVEAEQSDSVKKLSPAHWARSKKIDVKHIALDLRFDWQKKQAYGTAAITFSPFNLAERITLDAGLLTIHSVTLLNGASLKFNYDGGDKNDGLEIILDRTYKANEDITVRIDYHTNWTNISDPNSLGGTNGKGLRFFGPTFTEPKRRQIIWTMGEPEGNRYWFPGYDSPNDLRTTEFTATVDEKFTVISNGTLTKKENADGTHSFHYKADIPYANHLTSFVVGEFVDIKQEVNGLPVHNYAFPDEVEATKASVVQLPEMIKYFSEVTGAKYPYSSYSQAFVQDLPWGVGGNSLSIQTENMVDDDRTHADFLYLWDDLEAETLAQQWFGNYLTPGDWSHSWLIKGFGRYFSELYDEQRNGSNEFHLYSRSWDRNSAYLPNWNSGYRRPLVTNYYDDATTLINDSYAGFHGAQVLHMLRRHLGEEAWWKAIKLYIKSNAGKLVTTEALRKAAEEASGEPMDWFFDQWVYKMGHPVFVVTKNYDATNKQLLLTIRQTQKVDTKDPYPQVAFFQGKMEIAIDGRIEKIWLEPKEENVFTFVSMQQPKLVNFDYEDTWVKELTFEKSLEELQFQFENDADVTGRNWAMGQLVNLVKNEKTSQSEKEKIYASFRNVILGNSYWRFKGNALFQLQGLLATTTPASLDKATIDMLLAVIKNEKAWVRSSAIRFLGLTHDVKYTGIYLNYLNDPSDRVINSAAIAIGKSKSSKAFGALAKLVNKPSWKNQSLISSLTALKELKDSRGYEIAFKALTDLTSPHWVLAVPIWDYRIIAAQTIASLGRSSEAYPFLSEGFKKAVAENDIHGIFYNTLLITELADPRAQEIFELLKIKFKDDANAMMAVDQYETQFKNAIKTN